MMRLMVTGAAGVIGSQLCQHLGLSKHTVIPVDISESADIVCADLRDASAVRHLMDEYHPDVLLHLAANKNVFFCEENREAAREVNFGMTQTLARACADFNTRMIFFSSDYVFGAEDRIWKETDVPCPTTQYGRDKAESEKVIGELLVDFAVVRTSGLYGFPGDLVQVVKSVLLKGEEFNAFDNLINCPTWTGDLFQMLDAILDDQLNGIFHCVGSEAFSRFEYAACVAEECGLDVSLVRAESLDFSKDIRPPILRLDGARTYQTMGVVPGTLEDNLRKMNDE